MLLRIARLITSTACAATVLFQQSGHKTFGSTLVQTESVDLSVGSYLNTFESSPVPGAIVPFRIGIGNLLGALPASFQITETVPVNARFSAAASNLAGLTWSCPDNSGAGTTCVVSATPADVEFSGWLKAPFAVALLLPSPLNQNTITNVVRIGSSHTDVAPANNIYTHTVPLNLAEARANMSQRLLADANGNGKADPGDVLSYTVQVTNAGYVPAAFTIIEPFFQSSYDPDHLHTFAQVLTDTAVSSQGSISTVAYIVGHDNVRANLGMLAPGATGTLRVLARIRDSLPLSGDTVANQASIESTIPGQLADVPFMTVTNRVSTTLGPRANLQVGVGSATTPDPAIGSASYSVYYNYIGQTPASNVVVTQTLPEGSEMDPSRSASGWTCVGRICTYAVGSIPPGHDALPSGGSMTFTLKPIPALPSSTTSVSVTATIARNTSEVAEADAFDNQATITVPFGARARLVVSQSYRFTVDQGSDGAWQPGDTVEYTVRVTNTSSTRTAAGVSVNWDETDMYTYGNVRVLAQSLVTSQGIGQSNASTAQGSFGDLPPGSSAFMRFLVVLNQAPSASVGIIDAAIIAGDQYGLATRGNVSVVPVYYERNASVSKSIQTDQAHGVADQLVTFTIRITNTGILPLDSIYLQDFDTDSYSVPDANCVIPITTSVTTSGNIGPVMFYTRTGFFPDQLPPGMTVTLTSLASGQSGTVQLRAQVSNPCSGDVSNQARLLIRESQATQAFKKSNLVRAPIYGASTSIYSFTLETTARLADVAPGERVTFTIGAMNVGSATLANYALVQTHYDCLTVITQALTIDSGSITAVRLNSIGEVRMQFGDLEVGGRRTAIVPAIVSSDPNCSEIDNWLGIHRIRVLIAETQGAQQSPTPTSTPSPTNTPTPAQRKTYLPLVRR